MESAKDAIKVTVGIFSGRPNPELSIAGEAAEELVTMVKRTLGKKPTHPPPPPGLGYYYGFMLLPSKEASEQYGIPMEFKVYRGVITRREGKREEHWGEASELERFLVEQAYQQGYGDLLEHVGVGKLDWLKRD